MASTSKMSRCDERRLSAQLIEKETCRGFGALDSVGHSLSLVCRLIAGADPTSAAPYSEKPHIMMLLVFAYTAVCKTSNVYFVACLLFFKLLQCF